MIFSFSDKMAAHMAYSTGRIQFIPDDHQNDEHEYSERSIIRLMEEEFPNAIIRALDVENSSQVWKLLD